MPPYCEEHQMYHHGVFDHEEMRTRDRKRAAMENRRAHAEKIARHHLDGVLGNTPSERMDALDHDDYAQLLAAFTAAALQALTEKEDAR